MPKKEAPRRGSPKSKVLVKNSGTTEDLVVEAIKKGGLDKVVLFLRDWCGSREIRKCLNKLNHRDPIDRFTHARRYAVEIYARRHGLTPANLMVEIVGEQGRKDPRPLATTAHILRGSPRVSPLPNGSLTPRDTSGGKSSNSGHAQTLGGPNDHANVTLDTILNSDTGDRTFQPV